MDSKRVDAIYEQIAGYSVELSPDAWSLGPKHVHELISMTRGYINSVTHLLQEILRERQNLDRAKHAAETLFRVESDRLLSSDDRIRRLPNIEDRRATVNMFLREQQSEIQRLEGQLLDLGYVERAVRHRYNELKATMTDIRAQRALIRDAIDSGSFYGDETGTSRGTHQPVPNNSFSEEEIERSMSELNDMLVAGTPPPEAPAKSVSVPKTPPPEPPKTPEIDDFSDLIDGVESAVPVATVASDSPESEVDKFLEGDDLTNLFDDDDGSV